MIINKKFNYFQLTRQEDENGVRTYNIPDGTRLPSVTTILSSVKDQTHIKEWQNNVGIIEADRIKNEASILGNAMHENLENFILGNKMSGSFMSKALANVIIKHGLSKIDEVWGTEVPLYSSGLYAGTTDLVATWSGRPAIIDFKNSLRPKKIEWIDDYFMQLCAYKLCHDEMYGTDIRCGVIMIATRDGKYQEFEINGKELDYYTYMWLETLEKYYQLFGNK